MFTPFSIKIFINLVIIYDYFYYYFIHIQNTYMFYETAEKCKTFIGSKHRHRTSEAQLLDHDLLELDEGEEDLLEEHGSSSGAAGSQPVHLTQLKKLPGKKIRKPSVFSTR